MKDEHPLFKVDKNGHLYVLGRGKKRIQIKPTNKALYRKARTKAGFLGKNKKAGFLGLGAIWNSIKRTHKTIRGFFGHKHPRARPVSTVNQMDGRRATHARLAQAAYSQTKKVGTWTLVKSDKDLSIYRNDRLPNSKTYVFALAGTRPSIRDLKNDLGIAVNDMSRFTRIKSVETKIKKFMDSHPEARATVTGHSMGGAAAHHVQYDLAPQYKGRLEGAWSYNPGVSAVTGTSKGEAALKRMETMLKGSDHHVTTMENDAVSASLHGLSGVKDMVTLKSKHSGPMGLIKNHSISHFVL